jgi:hypothetical protein
MNLLANDVDVSRSNKSSNDGITRTPEPASNGRARPAVRSLTYKYVSLGLFGSASDTQIFFLTDKRAVKTKYLRRMDIWTVLLRDPSWRFSSRSLFLLLPLLVFPTRENKSILYQKKKNKPSLFLGKGFIKKRSLAQ